MTDKKIKVEADVTTKKNVSSGIGKGFGIVIGVFLALIVIAVSCGILISSSADKIEKKSNEITANAVKEFEQETQKVQEKVQRTIEESLPVDEKAKEKTEDFKFSPNSIVNTQNGITLSLDDFKYEIKGENWGKLTELTVTVLNKGNNAFQPKVWVFLYDENDRKEEWFQTKAEIEFDMWQLDIGEHVTKKAIVNIPFNGLNITKKLELALLNSYEFGNKPIVVVEKEFKVE